MHDLAYRQQKIQEKRKQTPRRQFVREVGSCFALTFYKHTGRISKYPETSRRKHVIDYLEHDRVANEYVGVYDPSRSFFENFQHLSDTVPYPNKLAAGVNENSTYAESVAGSNDVYLSFAIIFASQVFYSFHVKDGSQDVYNSCMVRDHAQSVYQSFGVIHASFVFFSRYIYNAQHIWYCQNMVGCTECINCTGLTNQSYCIDNKQYTKEAYLQIKPTLLRELNQHAERHYASQHVTAMDIGGSHTNGLFNIMSYDIEQGYCTYQVNKGRNCILVGGVQGDESIYDAIIAGSPYAKHFYAGCNLGNGEHYYCSNDIHGCFQVYYCNFCIDCSYCLGCIGLKNKSYCIFNQQYSKEERYEKVNEIFSQMDKDGTLGEFFPPSMNPFYFNDTAAYLIDPTFTKEEMTAMGYLRRDEPIKVDIPEGVEVVKTSELGQYEEWKPHPASPERGGAEGGGVTSNDVVGKTWRIDPAILKKVIIDEHGNAYRIVKMEYDFLMKHGLPLPRKHWLERMKENFQIN